MDERDLELLSAYLDGQLPAEERSALEARLRVDDALRRELDLLRETTGLIRSLPVRKAPRNYTLTPAQASRSTTPVLLSPWVSAISAVAAAFLLVVGVLQLSLQALPSESAVGTDIVLRQEAASAPTMAELAAQAPPSETAAPQLQAAPQSDAEAALAETAAEFRVEEDATALSTPPPISNDTFAAPAVPDGQARDGAAPQANDVAAGAVAAAQVPTTTVQPSPVPTQTATSVPTSAPIPTLIPTEIPAQISEPAPGSAIPSPDVGAGVALISLAFLLLVLAAASTVVRWRRRR
jgi:hypothetical protein